MARPDTHEDYLMELVSHPGWKVLQAEAKRRAQSHLEKLKDPAKEEFDFVRKEVLIGKVVELEEFLRAVDNIADGYAKKYRK